MPSPTRSSRRRCRRPRLWSHDRPTSVATTSLLTGEDEAAGGRRVRHGTAHLASRQVRALSLAGVGARRSTPSRPGAQVRRAALRGRGGDARAATTRAALGLAAGAAAAAAAFAPHCAPARPELTARGAAEACGFPPCLAVALLCLGGRWHTKLFHRRVLQRAEPGGPGPHTRTLARPLRNPPSPPRTLPPPCVSRGTPPAPAWVVAPRRLHRGRGLHGPPPPSAHFRVGRRWRHPIQRGLRPGNRTRPTRNGGPCCRPRGWRLPHPCRQRALAPRPSRPLAGGVAAGAKGPSSARLGAAPHHPSELAS